MSGPALQLVCKAFIIRLELGALAGQGSSCDAGTVQLLKHKRGG